MRQAHPGAVTGLVLRGLFLASDDEVAWFLTGLRRFLPEAWSAFAAGAGDSSAAGLLRYYYERSKHGRRGCGTALERVGIGSHGSGRSGIRRRVS